MKPSVTLSAGEWRIMEHLWDNSPQTLTELVKAVSPVSGWSKSTIVTMVSRLEAKGAVSYTEGIRARQYAPAIPREQAALEETESFLHRVYRGSVGMMVHTLADGRGLTDQDIEELSAVLEKARGERT